MKNVSITISNDFKKSKFGRIIGTITISFEGDTLKKAVGQAMNFANEVMNSQYDEPVVNIAGVELPAALAKKFKVSHWDFEIEFGNIREYIMAQLAFTSDEAGAEYIRATDINGVYKNTKSFTPQQIAAQAKERLRMTRDITRWVKEDAKSSVIPEYVEQRRTLLAEAAKAKRIAAKSQALIN
jgi:hypothetical protein